MMRIQCARDRYFDELSIAEWLTAPQQMQLSLREPGRAGIESVPR